MEGSGIVVPNLAFAELKKAIDDPLEVAPSVDIDEKTRKGKVKYHNY